MCMQLYATESKTKYRVYFNELETNNLIKILGDDINKRNIQLCNFIEKTLPRIFNECKNKRIMVLDIVNNSQNIKAIVLLQDINIDFLKPKEKNHYFKITQVNFKDGYVFKNWLINTQYSYKIISVSPRNVKVIIFNMTESDEMNLSQVDAEIDDICNIAKYFFVHTAYKLEKCFKQIA